MATCSEDIINDLLICAICLEKMNTPKYLPCLHTFCECCVVTLITSGLEKENKQSFLCPICRSPVTSPRENCSPEDWAKQLPKNFLIIGLIEGEKLKRPEKPCMSCERLDVQTTAAFLCLECADTLCDICYNCHKSNKSSSDHEVKPLSSISKKEKFPKAFTSSCSVHTSEKIKLFCMDHDIPCCTMCISITHRKCDEIVTIEDAAKIFCSTTEVDNLKQRLENHSMRYETLINRSTYSLSDLETQCKMRMGEVDTMCKIVIQEVQNFKAKRKSELQKIYEEKKNVVETVKVSFKNRKKAIDNEVKIMQAVIENASEVQVMIEAKKITNHLNEQEKQSTSENFDYRMTVKPPKELTKLTEILQNACEIKCDLRQTYLLNRFLNTNPVQQVRSKINATNKKKLMGWYMSLTPLNAICFIVSEEIYLTGILSYGCRNLTPCKVKVQLKENTDDNVHVVSEIKTTLKVENSENCTIKVEFPYPLLLKKKVCYTVSISLNEAEGKYFDYGAVGKSVVICEGVRFKFENVPKKYNSRTKVFQGQIPGLMFMKL